MRFQSLFVALAVLAVSGTTVAGAQTQRDVIQIGDQYYLRTEQVAHTLTGSRWYCDHALAVHDGVCSLFMRDDSDPTYGEGVYLRHFDADAQPLHDSLLVDPTHGVYASQCATARYGDYTWTVWSETSDYLWARCFDTYGVPHGDTFLVAELEGMWVDMCVGAETDGTRTAIVFADHDVDAPGYRHDVFFVAYSLGGTTLGGMIPVATTVERERQPQAALLSDGAYVVGYRWLDGSVERGDVYLRRVNADFTLEEPVQVAGHDIPFLHVAPLADGSVVVGYSLFDEFQSYAQRFDGYAQPLADPVPLGSYFVHAASTQDGRLVIGGTGGDPAWIQIYDSSWQALDGEIEIGMPGTLWSSIDEMDSPLAYGDDGTVWIAWVGENEEGENTFITSLKPLELGDANCDGVVNLFDIDPFVLAMSDPSGYEAAYPDCDRMLADTDGDGSVSNFDIDPFVATLVAS